MSNCSVVDTVGGDIGGEGGSCTRQMVVKVCSCSEKLCSKRVAKTLAASRAVSVR